MYGRRKRRDLTAAFERGRLMTPPATRLLLIRQHGCISSVDFRGQGAEGGEEDGSVGDDLTLPIPRQTAAVRPEQSLRNAQRPLRHGLIFNGRAISKARRSPNLESRHRRAISPEAPRRVRWKATACSCNTKKALARCSYASTRKESAWMPGWPAAKWTHCLVRRWPGIGGWRRRLGVAH
jgi:hypothetical protein